MSNGSDAQVPEGWSVEKLGEVTDIVFSNVDKKSYPDEEKRVKLCNYMDVYSKSYITNGIQFMEATANDREIAKFSLLRDDVMITKDSETPDDIAVSAVVAEELSNVLCGYHLAMLRPKEGISGVYLSHLFGLPSVQHRYYQLANGSTRFGLTTEAITGSKIPLPPFPEQKRIASILTSVDDVIEKTEAQISKLQDLKKGMMTELLTKGIGHTEFKNSAVGKIPASWEIKPLTDILSKLIDCEHKTAPYVDSSKYLVVRTSNIRDGQLVEEDIKYTTEDGFKEWTRRGIPSKGDILFTREAPAGESCLVPEDKVICLGQRMVLLKPDTLLINSDFLIHYLTSDVGKAIIYQLSIGTTVTRINIEDIYKIPCVLPTLDEQNSISNVIGSVEKSIIAKIKSLSASKSLKKALMNDLLTGKKRVTIDN